MLESEGSCLRCVRSLGGRQVACLVLGTSSEAVFEAVTPDGVIRTIALDKVRGARERRGGRRRGRSTSEPSPSPLCLITSARRVFSDLGATRQSRTRTASKRHDHRLALGPDAPRAGEVVGGTSGGRRGLTSGRMLQQIQQRMERMGQRGGPGLNVDMHAMEAIVRQVHRSRSIRCQCRTQILSIASAFLMLGKTWTA